MATYNLRNAVLRMVYDDGLTLDGKPKRKSKTYSSINYSATANQMLQAAVALSGLSSKPLLQVEKQEVNEIN